MQNLTAHYNILFNAKEILRQKQDAYASAFVDNYNEILAVYQDTTQHSNTVDKDLDAATVKANYLINMKDQSKYIGDAYLVLGQANYLEGNFYNAVEYFRYVINSFPKRKDLVEQGQVWKARTLIYLDKLPEAKATIDSAIDSIKPKKRVDANIYATKLAYDIVVMDYKDGEEMAQKAVQYCHDGNTRLRWTFILSQLEELNNEQDKALQNYARISKSNALFEMAFNASLNVIRIRDTENGIKVDRVGLLMALMKNPNNADFKDQIFYNIAQLRFAEKDIDGAIKDYNRSVRASTKNETQKGLSYLRLAEIYFDDKADYIKSKKYYDSTLNSLPVTYPGYAAIQKKGANLAYLAERLLIVSREDTLQALARMDKKTRDSVVDKMVNDHILEQEAIANAAKASAAAANTSATSSFAGGSFYFDNAGAVSQGYNDFKRVWGNRKLEDDWRRSTRPAGNVTANTSANMQSSDPDAPVSAGKTRSGGASGYRQGLVKDIPLTADMLAQSNLHIYNAYYDIANFYRDVLDDKKESIIYFEKLLARFPNDPNRPAIYYALYRLYSDVNVAKADIYKDKIVKEFPDTPFAKIITDPDYFRKLGDKDAELTSAYNAVFDLYDKKEYKKVIDSVPAMMKKYPDNKYAAQLYYLQTIAQGHFEPLTPFKDSLQQLINKFPQDRLVNPLAKQHLAFISANKASMQSRPVVLADVDPKEIPFTLAEANKKKAAYRHPPRAPLPYVPKQETKQEPKQQQAVNVTLPPQPGKKDSVSQPVVKHPYVSKVFNMLDSANYYFVVNVATATTNLASSRFGIGQFNRTNYTGSELRHQLLPVGDNNQLIYVGMFGSLSDVKKYARDIVPLLGDIMKVPVGEYSYFIITKQNLAKITDKKTLDNYVEYYQNNY